MIKLIILTALLGVVAAESYRPRGWRPDGPRFEPSRSERLQNYAGPSQSYGPPGNAPSYPQQQPEATTERASTTAEPPTTTTRRSREPTTATPDITDEEDVESSPALAIANSFAFNRPVYVYNSYPYYPGLTFV